ncbi:MAG: DUF819 family protein [Candidatus Omnitrophica bacterium]|nr:DUF819 family protein [Candidatus Omnitrophota bacterium]
MTKKPMILLFFIFLVGFILFVHRKFRRHPVFKYLPVPLWCYFLPMFASGMGIIPRENAVYPAISTHLLPACLILLLAGAHLKNVWKLGPAALISMAAGSQAIFTGGPLLLFFFKPYLPENAWMGLGALAASWTGGSANMLAVKEAIGVPESLFSILVIVDSVMAYAWMACVMEMSSWQESFDRWNRADKKWLYSVGGGEPEYIVGSVEEPFGKKIIFKILISILIAFVFGELSVLLGAWLGQSARMLNQTTWAVLSATAMGIALSIKRVRAVDDTTMERTGFFLLYVLIASVGARADLSGIFQTPLFLLFGFLWVAWMAFVLFCVGKIFRIPLFFLATASQANVGGPATATMVAGVYQPHLSFVGLLLAVLGNIFGTYLGIAASYLMRWVQ